jgi:hypothetical protein
MLVKTKPSFGTATLVIASYRLGWLEKHHLDGFGIETAMRVLVQFDRFQVPSAPTTV